MMITFCNLISIAAVSLTVFLREGVSATSDLIKLPKVELRVDSNSTFKKRRCSDTREDEQLCTKEWIAHLCPNACNAPESLGDNSCREDFEGKFPLRGKKRRCSFLSSHRKICGKRKWVKELCPVTCGCKKIDNPMKKNEEEEEQYVGIIDNNMFSTADSQPLQAKMQLFGSSAINHYRDCEQLKSDLTSAASIIVNYAIADNAKLDAKDLDRIREYIPMMAADSAPADSQPVPNSAAGEDSYDTNVQVAGVDEADVIKSTNETVYAAYGDKLIIWEARTLKKLSVTQMPSELDKRRILSRSYFPYRRQTSIQGLLLYEDRLAVIVSHDQWFYPFQSFQNRNIIQNYGSLSIYLYDVSNGLEPKLLATKALQGNYVDARMIKNTTYLVTTSQVDTYFHLTRHFSRYTHQELYNNMTKSEYIRHATQYANNTVIPSFIQKFMSELNAGESCENLIQLTMFQSFKGKQPQKIHTIPRASMINGLTRVTGFQMDEDYEEVDAKKGKINTNNTIQSVSTVILLPSTYNTQIYASTDKLVLATRGYETNANGTDWNELTYFQVLLLNESNIESHSIGKVPGYLLNQYAMDIYKGHLHVATTTSAKWGCIDDNPPASSAINADIMLFRPCKREIIVDSDNFIHVLRLPTTATNTSDTSTYKAATLEQVGSLNDLGKTGERIEAVRFMQDKAFVVTFLRTDPLYTIDLSNHTNPREIGALEITGYSNYLHPYDVEGNFLIGIGQEADENGRALGLKISLFDATNFSDVTIVGDEYVVAREAGLNETNVWSSSAAQYDPKAFRFLPKSSKLIVPASIRDYNTLSNNFDGFIVFDLSTEKGISLSFNFSHIPENKKIDSYCWYNARLTSRSLVHNGIVTTTKGHTVLAHNLNGMNMTLPPLNLDENNTECGKGGYWLE